MAELWFISDTHFYHDNILKFTGKDRQLVRPGFRDVQEMNERMVDNWNRLVQPGHHVYHLGDVAMKVGRKAEHINRLLSRLHGQKRLVVGNHDDIKHPVLHKHFRKMTLWRGFKEFGFTCTHIPLMLSSLRDGAFCVHGHIHQNVIPNPQYINVCVERTNYSPIHLDTILAHIKKHS